ncbi:MAG TPA: metalloregulator ArsR/SmtB family transcription factor [candidate division Zixibacteria bacterium]|nr:helix-turn-helix transcriptional regulator [candidate division Zixibacteria bacterium]MDD4917725.1 metalloregulator ArsR/SmtB family transcription factor [candidate division Zixibacteria bacterium]MDM7972812.1 metalloregulator ArsR/SmtB family transcription factor [candidate division Zixibacteria bacterium]HOD66288.1 metalloregulator ArsR/SmtB family transcription factor [candidate division Zixibacteria bacterium]HOZ08905.1 metalloregulator ArsR/SmtB family transcription factor [candidate di
MAAKRTKYFFQASNQQVDLVARAFRALGDPTRLKMLKALESGEQSVQDLVAQFTCSQPNISRHLSILTAAGLVAKNKQGPYVLYRVADPRIFELCDLVCGHVYSLLARYSGKASSA